MLLIWCLHLNQISVAIWGRSTLFFPFYTSRVTHLANLFCWNLWRKLICTALLTSFSFYTWPDSLITDTRNEYDILDLRVRFLRNLFNLFYVFLFQTRHMTEKRIFSRFQIQFWSIQLNIIDILLIFLYKHWRLCLIIAFIILISTMTRITRVVGTSLSSSECPAIFPVLSSAPSPTASSQIFIFRARNQCAESFILIKTLGAVRISNVPLSHWRHRETFMSLG